MKADVAQDASHTVDHKIHRFRFSEVGTQVSPRQINRSADRGDAR